MHREKLRIIGIMTREELTAARQKILEHLGNTVLSLNKDWGEEEFCICGCTESEFIKDRDERLSKWIDEYARIFASAIVMKEVPDHTERGKGYNSAIHQFKRNIEWFS